MIGQPSGYLFQDDGDPTPMIVRLTREQCVKFYKDISWGLLSPEMHPHGHEHLKRFRERFKKMTIGDAAKAYLCGKNLACWCKIGEPCHADILLELANK